MAVEHALFVGAIVFVGVTIWQFDLLTFDSKAQVGPSTGGQNQNIQDLSVLVWREVVGPALSGDIKVVSGIG